MEASAESRQELVYRRELRGDLYIQPYINVKNTSGGNISDTNKDSVFAYIGPSKDDISGQKWQAYFIYDPGQQTMVP